MAKIYISGPVTGTEDYDERFSKAESRLEAAGYETVNPVRVTAELPEMDYEEYMTVCLTMLRMCDGIYMLEGWDYSPGASREYGYALGKDIPFLFEGSAVPQAPEKKEKE